MNTAAVNSQHRRTGTRAAARGVRAHRRPQNLSLIETATLLVIVILLVVGVFSARPRGDVDATTRTVRVETGDTLWSIARTHPVSGLSTAQAAEKIARDNNLGTGTLAAGAVLVVPAADMQNPHRASR
jgi:Tfp pilus assembly protein FimV